MTDAPLTELGCYGLAGHSASPRDVVAEARRAEELGIGSMFLSERFNVKDAAVLAGAVAASTTRLGIGTAATNPGTRHPVVSATMAATAHRMSEGRYCFGLGRGFDVVFDLYGVPRVTGAQLRDTADVLRRLWAGEKFAHEGALGTYPYLFLLDELGDRIPILMVAIGPKSLRLAGAVADAVVLHTYVTDETVARSVEHVRRGAEEAGRDPASVRIWACTAVIDDALPEELRLRKTVGRLATYLQGYGEVLVAANGWDPADLQRFREDPVVLAQQGAFDAVGTIEQLTHLAEHALPASWLAAAITGTARRCALGVRDQLAATGVDGVILHGATPDELAGVVTAYREVRDPARPMLPANPGWMVEPVRAGD